MAVYRNENHASFYLYCLISSAGNEKWSIETSREAKFVSVTGRLHSKSADRTFDNVKDEDRSSWGWKEFMNWDEMMKNYVTDDTLRVETHVKIKKTTGIEKKKLMNFDESKIPFSDVVLVVEGQKFYVSKLFLAGQSPYFNALLRGNFEESKKEEVTLTGIKATDFQNFMEALHGELAVDDDTVSGILHLADMYDSKTVIKQCQAFFMEKSEKSTKEKLEFAIKYNWDNLKNKCLLEIKTIDDIRSALPGDPIQMDKDVLVSLLQKSISYQI